MATRETSRLHIPYPGQDDQGNWDAKFVTMMAQIDARVFANLENLKPVFAELPTVLNDTVSGELQQTGDWILVSRTFSARVTVPTASTLTLQPQTMIGVRITAGATTDQASAWETFATADVDAEVQIFGYVDAALKIWWYNGTTLDVGETATLFEMPTLPLERAREDADIIVGGGGGLLLVGDVLTWKEPIVVTSPRSGGTITIAAGGLGVLAGEFVYVVPSTRPMPTEAGTLLAAAVVPDDGIAIGARLGSVVLLRNERRATFALTAANGAAVTTGSAAAGGGTTAGSIFLGVARGCANRLRVKANGNTVLTDLNFYADAAHTEPVHTALAQDCYTGGVPPYYDYRATWPLVGWAADLVAGLLYYEFTNNGANASTYRIELTGEGEV
jgi:hypothetical protein